MKKVVILLILSTIFVSMYQCHLHNRLPPMVHTIGRGNCRFKLDYGVDSSFSKGQYADIITAIHIWSIVSNYQICFRVYVKDVKAKEYLDFFTDGKRTIYNAQDNLSKQIIFQFLGKCFRNGCLGLAFNSLDIFLTKEDTYAVAIHEIGHTLGMPHSPNVNDIMYPVLSTKYISTNDIKVLNCLMSSKPPFAWDGDKCQYQEASNVEHKVGRGVPKSDAGAENFPFYD